MIVLTEIKLVASPRSSAYAEGDMNREINIKLSDINNNTNNNTITLVSWQSFKD